MAFVSHGDQRLTVRGGSGRVPGRPARGAPRRRPSSGETVGIGPYRRTDDDCADVTRPAG